MIELAPSQFSLATALFSSTRYGVLAAGTLEGGHPGRVFVDDPAFPRVSLLCTRVGYYFLAGQPDIAAVNTWLPQIFTGELAPQQVAMLGDPQVLLFYPSHDWRAPLLAQFDTLEQPIAIHKKRMLLPHHTPALLADLDKALPGNLRLRAYDQAILEADPELGSEAVLFYGSIAAFL